MFRTTLIISTFTLLICSVAAKEPKTVAPYNVDEAYQVYSVLLPKEESYGFAKGPVVVQQETVSDQPISGACLSEGKAREFRAAIANFG